MINQVSTVVENQIIRPSDHRYLGEADELETVMRFVVDGESPAYLLGIRDALAGDPKESPYMALWCRYDYLLGYEFGKVCAIHDALDKLPSRSNGYRKPERKRKVVAKTAPPDLPETPPVDEVVPPPKSKAVAKTAPIDLLETPPIDEVVPPLKSNVFAKVVPLDLPETPPINGVAFQPSIVVKTDKNGGEVIQKVNVIYYGRWEQDGDADSEKADQLNTDRGKDD